MFRSVRAIVTALLVTVATMSIPADPAAAAACSTGSSSSVRGGYVVTIYCPGAGFIDGYGSSLTDANLEALYLYQLYTNSRLSCDGSSSSVASGGYDVTIYCAGLGFIDGVGSTLTGAARTARLAATIG